MGYRLSKIYTRTGDDGTTGLGDGSRVQKDDLRVECYGSVDELNSAIGVLLAEASVTDPIRSQLLTVQHDLFDIGGELSIPDFVIVQEAAVTQLETWLDQLNASLPPLENFILPGGNRPGALAHLARTVCRRTERHMVALQRAAKINAFSLNYLNRLSDYLFVTARTLVRQQGGEEILWQKKDTE